MKINVRECEGCFGIDMTAEDLVEGALLVRMGMNSTREMRLFKANVYNDGSIILSIVAAKARNSSDVVPNRNRRQP